MSLKIGDIITFKRSFTMKDVQLFTEVSCDEGAHHITPDEQGRLVIQGLLTATLPTKIGGDANVLARTMNFEFIRPVYTGDTIKCEVEILEYEWHENKNRTSIGTIFMCRNQDGIEVLKGSFSGVIL
ncbi:acyl dehydratase [Solibacillus kalamii]|uniref:Enoyl-CoA hydratase n=1 Tax=Solibacillus kalamii TaxID=1748298 RepID=A0ABX3ZIE6_9BACL|nr:enoyl-CoA hydratase [Solibacillus kalamii]MBM7665516.1 acyl dehydratase [Solibacillus kalamii]OUZ39339.1 enoyl-CoA hydratase [Solibacillus kalamii]